MHVRTLSALNGSRGFFCHLSLSCEMLVPREPRGRGAGSHLVYYHEVSSHAHQKKKNFQPLQKARYYYLCLTAYSLAVIRIREIGRDR